MQTLTLPNQRQTTQLGFGGSALMAGISRRESLALLEAAFDAGIRHFDVAPMYGYGAAESCLGDFLARHPGQLTVTTKYGIAPPPNQGLLRLARRAAAPVLKALPGLKQHLAGSVNSTIAAQPRLPFTPAATSTSLDQSLRNLRVDHIDLFLLHEAEAEDLHDDALLRFLEDAVTAGKIGAFGCGSPAAIIPTLLAERRAYCPVLQFEWSVLDAPQPAPPAFTLHHRALTATFAELKAALASNLTLNRKWSDQLGLDLAQPGTLAALMLKASLARHPTSLLLVSSRNPHHIAENVRVATDTNLLGPARTFYQLVQAEGAALLTTAETHLPLNPDHRLPTT